MFFQPHRTTARSSRSSNALSLAATATIRRSLLLAAFFLGACDQASPLQTNNHASHEGGLMLSSLTRASNASALDALTQLTAPFHDVDAAQAAGYNLFVGPPQTAPDGCISSAQDGGMGYHYTRGNNLGDDSVSLLDPEFLVYAPKNGPHKDGEARTRLAAFDYFIFYSAKWPGPSDAGFTRPPTLHDFSTMKDLPDIAFAPSRFGGWMVHIWLWENNPGGLFANWNTAVPLCEGSTF
jgi:hypothetical protein